MKSFQDRGKRHLLITGSKQIGKTTLLEEILKDLDNYGGIRSYLFKEKDLPIYVILEDILDRNVNAVIGRRMNNTMEPILKGFEETGVEILKRYRNSDKDTIIIDEIGFLETNAKKYQKEILALFEEKNVIALLRKEDNPFLNQIKEIKSSFLVDLDNFTETLVP